MKYTMRSQGSELHVDFDVAEEHRDRLFEEFGRCRMGTCNCPTTQYSELEDLEISEVTATHLHVRMVPRADKPLNLDDITRCLDELASLFERRN